MSRHEDRLHAASHLFGSDDEHGDEHGYVDEHGHGADHGHDEHPSAPLPVSRSSRRQAKERRRRVRRRRVVLAFALVVLVGLGVGAYQLSGRLFDFGGSSAADYSGEGSGSVNVTVTAGQGTAAIGQTLVDADVVKSAAAFTQAAAGDDRALGIQPGVYQLRKQMSGQAALNLLLDPASRQVLQLVIREGEIQPQVEQDLATALKVPLEQVQAAAKQVDQIVPAAYLTPTPPTSLEGFLFPATYQFDPGTTPLQAFQRIVLEYTSNDRDAGLSSAAAKLGISPYQALTIASIAEAEAKFPGDYAKVARVILNRIAINRPLQIDATTIYGAKIAGVDPSTITYSTYATPYNSYLNAGLTPTPIGSPGEAVMAETAAPPAGDWIYYVNGDQEGHLFFTADEQQFLAAVETCKTNGWGCG